MQLLIELFAGLRHKGPGSPEATRRAWSLLPTSEPVERLVEFGCGSGAATLTLAALSEARITAIDRVGAFIAELQHQLEAADLHNRVDACIGDMADPPTQPGMMDLVWSEGAIYHLGFAAGLERWRHWLRPGGLIAVTELTRLVPEFSNPVQRYWSQGYPPLTSVEGNLAALEKAGYTPLAHFVLPDDCWETHYYGPLERRMTTFAAEHQGEMEAESLLGEFREEIALWRNHRHEYGYVFYLGQRDRLK